MKKLLLFSTILFFTLLIAGPAYSCTLPPKKIVIKCGINNSLFQEDITCLDKDCTLNVTKNQSGRLLFNYKDDQGIFIINENNEIHFHRHYYIQEYYNNQEYYDNYEHYDNEYYENKKYFLEYYSDILNYLDIICIENLDDIKPIFFQEIKNWMTKENHRFRRDLVFEPASPDRELELKKSKNDYLNCHYKDFKKIGNWLIVKSETRGYCYNDKLVLPPCQNLKMSLFKFFFFLLKNPNSGTLPYLIGYLILLSPVVIFLIYLIKKKEVKLFFKPKKTTVIFTLVLGLPTFMFFVLFRQMTEAVGYFFGFYLLFSLIKYLYIKNKSRQR